MNNWRELKLMTKALGDVARLTIVYHLAHDGETTVTELTAKLGLSQPLVSWHLRKLRRAGLIQKRRVGRQVYCVLDTARYQHCLDSLERLANSAIQMETLPSGEALEAEAMVKD